MLLLKLMDWLEQEKKTHRDNDTIMNETAAQAYIENYALKLFQWADSMDRASTFNKNVVKAFYTASILMDVLQTFGETSEDIEQNKKYAKWKAAYIHNCLKSGETPIPGPPESGEGSEGPSLSSQNSNDQLPSPPRENSNEDVTPSFPAPTSSGGTLPSPPSMPQNLPGPSISGPSIPGPSIPSFPSPAVTPSTPSTPAPQPAMPALVTQPEQEISYIEAELINKCQKYIKFASSALNYDDYKEAKSNLIKVLNILNTGRES
ncbi:vacuolar protein sorting-associated protein VTA1 homolog [Diaphorina citri]|uniref:Vacuolar protein sorting-associated protein VTA1 homolog n=1 Tax=Diaphorina citri TaxID=121845 RepID=A0A1S3DP90_DIACI|nr:vacuolar protein sorting-associated protein VTA1 homolog [Diaphorina citri]